ncbi:MAG: hypothetical protein JSS35_04550 [Proteobacteria bacterium]|nr:hypothetical protein [Pseudomonadota bacterium]
MAVPSRAAALRAWDVRQDLFAEGLARKTDDPQATKAALAEPGVVLRRPAGSRGAFAVEPAALPDPPPTARRPKGGRAPKPPREPLRPPPDRGALDRAEAALERLEKRRLAEEARLDARRAALEAEAAKAQAAYVAARRKLAAALDAARAAYREAGGTD